MFAILGWIVFGFVIGLIARAVMPGTQSMGFIKTTLLGIAGSFLGGFLGSLISGGGFSLSATESWIGSFLGAFLLLAVGLFSGRRRLT